MSLELFIVILSLASSLSSIVFAYLSYKRTNNIDNKALGKTEGVFFSDIGYIKACVDRVEKNIHSIDERYRDVVERLAKVEETVFNVTKQVDQLYKFDSP